MVIIIRQRGSKYLAGKNVGTGTDYTLFALKEGVVKYIESSLNKSNPDFLGKTGLIELDKTGVSMHIYKKLVNVSNKKKIFDKTTEKKFEEVFKSLNQRFELDAPPKVNVEES